MIKNTVSTLSCLLLIIISFNNVASETIIFEETMLKISFVEGDVLSSSLIVEFENLPESQVYEFILSYGSEEEVVFSESTELELPSNIIQHSQEWKLALKVADQTRVLHTQIMETGV